MLNEISWRGISSSCIFDWLCFDEISRSFAQKGYYMMYRFVCSVDRNLWIRIRTLAQWKKLSIMHIWYQYYRAICHVYVWTGCEKLYVHLLWHEFWGLTVCAKLISSACRNFGWIGSLAGGFLRTRSSVLYHLLIISAASSFFRPSRNNAWRASFLSS